MPLRRFYLLVGIIAVISLTTSVVILYWDEISARVVSLQGARPDTDRYGDADQPYAFYTEERLVLVREGRVVAEVRQIFDAGRTLDEPVWTHDGRYLAFFSDAATRTGETELELIVVESISGEMKRVPCGDCDHVTAIEDDMLLISGHVSAGDESTLLLWRYDPAGPTGPGQFARVAPFGHSRLVASTPDHVLSYEQAEWSSTGAYGIDMRISNYANSEDVIAGWFESNHYTRNAALRGDGERSDRFVISATPDPGLCWSRHSVTVVDADKAVIETEMTAAEPPGIDDLGGGLEVMDLWWDLDDQLYASISSWTCDTSQGAQPDVRVPLESMEIWRLDDRTWVRTDFPRAAMMEQLDVDTYLRLEKRSCIGDQKIENWALDCNVGVLYIRTSGVDKKVADGVISITTPPHHPEDG